MDFISTYVIPAFVGSGSAWILVRFFGERLLAHRLSKDLERYKTELAERTDVLKTQLGIFAHEQNVALSRIDAQRAEAIRTIYACIRNIINPLSKIAAGVPIVDGTPKQTKEFYFRHAVDAHGACGALANQMADFAIYFDNETYKEIANFAQSAMEVSAVYLRPLRESPAEGADNGALAEIAERERAPLKNSFDQNITQKAKHLTAVFRFQLGIDEQVVND